MAMAGLSAVMEAAPTLRGLDVITIMDCFAITLLILVAMPGKILFVVCRLLPKRTLSGVGIRYFMIVRAVLVKGRWYS